MQVIPQQSTQTHQTCHYRHATKTSGLFLLFNTGADFSLRNNFANSGSFAKVSVLVYNYNSLGLCTNIRELSSLKVNKTGVLRSTFCLTSQLIYSLYFKLGFVLASRISIFYVQLDSVDVARSRHSRILPKVFRNI